MPLWVGAALVWLADGLKSNAGRVAAMIFVFNMFIAAGYLAVNALFPDGWLTEINSAIGAIPEGVEFYLHLAAFDAGLPVLLSALIARFLIRRIPVVG